jgi:hypothetical protein
MTFSLVALCRCSVHKEPKSNLCTALTTHNTTQNNSIISHAQKTTALHQPDVFVNETLRSLVTTEGGWAFHSANNCQGQPQTAQSVSVL